MGGSIFDVLDAEPGLDYVVAMAKNSVLVRDAEPAMAVARGQSEHVYTDVQYAAGTWAQHAGRAEQHEQKAPERRGRARVHLSHSRTWQ